MVIDRAKTVRGAFAGAVAAGVWLAQQPLDKPVFGVDYDDSELQRIAQVAPGEARRDAPKVARPPPKVARAAGGRRR